MSRDGQEMWFSRSQVVASCKFWRRKGADLPFGEGETRTGLLLKTMKVFTSCSIRHNRHHRKQGKHIQHRSSHHRMSGEQHIHKKGEIPSPEVCLSPGIHSSKEKVNYPCIEVDDLSSPGICYPPLDYVYSPLPGFYSPPPNYQYEATRGYGTTLPPLSPVQVSSLMVASGSHYHPCPSPYVKSPWPWQHVQSTGYANAHDLSVHPVSDGSEHSSL